METRWEALDKDERNIDQQKKVLVLTENFAMEVVDLLKLDWLQLPFVYLKIVVAVADVVYSVLESNCEPSDGCENRETATQMKDRSK